MLPKFLGGVIFVGGRQGNVIKPLLCTHNIAFQFASK